MIYTLTLNPAVDRELTVAAVEYDAVLRASDSRVDFGGKGFNVSRMLKSLGAESTAVGFLGGRTGDLLREGLQDLGIRTDFVKIQGETRTNISIVTENHGHYIKVNEKGPMATAEDQAALLAKIDAITRPGDWWVLAGSLPPGVADDFYARIIRTLNAHQVRAILDTTGESLRLGCLEKPFLVKPNVEEARSLTGFPMRNAVEVGDAATAIRALGAQNVVISMGKGGALLQTPQGSWRVESPRIQEKNPIGAGDSMVGGLVWALTEGLDLQKALAWGVASGAASASLSGTEVGSRSLVESLLAHVAFEELNVHTR